MSDSYTDQASVLGVLAKYMKDVSVLQRLLFAVTFLSPELPAFWTVVLKFATEGKLSNCSVTSKQIQAIIENIQAMYASAFAPDPILQQEIICLHLPRKEPVGHVLISPLTTSLFSVDMN